MALAPADPIQSIHQFFSLAEMPEVDDYERTLIAWHRERLIALRQNPNQTAWLAWYRDLMGAIQQLSSRWAQPRQEAGAPLRQEHPHAAALARLKDAGAPFLQRWNIRIQDQAVALKDQLLHQLHKIPIQETSSPTHTIFQVSAEDRAKLASYVCHSLGQWSRDIEVKLAPSWLDHLHKSIATERLSLPASKPPLWLPMSLAPSSIPPPQFLPQSTKKQTLFQTIQRVFQSTRSLIAPITVAIPGIVYAMLKDSKEERTLILSVVTFLFAGVAVVVGIVLGPKKLQEEMDHVREEQQQRALQSLQSWVASVLDNHKSRMQSLLSSAGPDMRSRLGEWVDASWPSPVHAQPSLGPRRDVSSLVFSLNSVRAAVATRISQIELESSSPSAPRS